jgi:hypothetical protein
MKPTARASPKSSAGWTVASTTSAAQSEASPPAASLRQVMAAVSWSFLGVRKCKAMARDVTTIKPVQVIVIGIAFAAMFVFTLLLIVGFITAAAS